MVILIDQVNYRDGYIERVSGMDDDQELRDDNYSVVETDLHGWGRANAVVEVPGCGHYLALLTGSDSPS